MKQVKELLEPYNYEVIIMADRGFKSIELLGFIDKLDFTYYIRVVGNTSVYIKEDEVIGKPNQIE